MIRMLEGDGLDYDSTTTRKLPVNVCVQANHVFRAHVIQLRCPSVNTLHNISFIFVRSLVACSKLDYYSTTIPQTFTQASLKLHLLFVYASLMLLLSCA